MTYIYLLLINILAYFDEKINWINAKLSLFYTALAVPFLILAKNFLTDFYAPIFPMIILCFIVGVCDFITGIWASRKNGVPIESKYFFSRKGATVCLFFVVLTCMLAVDRMLKEVHIGIPSFLMMTWMIFYSVYEMLSMLENVTRINPDLPVKKFLNLIKKKAPDSVKDAIDELEAPEPADEK